MKLAYKVQCQVLTLLMWSTAYWMLLARLYRLKRLKLTPPTQKLQERVSALVDFV